MPSPSGRCSTSSASSPAGRAAAARGQGAPAACSPRCSPPRFGLNVIAGDQYIALVLPARIFRAEFANAAFATTFAPGRRQRHRHLAARAVELVRRVHGGRAGRADAPLPAVLLLQHREPGAERALRRHRLQDREGRRRRTPCQARGRSALTTPAASTVATRAPTQTADPPKAQTCHSGDPDGHGGRRHGRSRRLLAAPTLRQRPASTGRRSPGRSRARDADARLRFQTLAVRKPDLDSGVYAYAKAGFGEYLGFFSAFGFWASACAGNVTYWVLIMSTLGAVCRWLGEGDTVLASLSPVGIWAFALLILPGVWRRDHQPDRDRRQDHPDPGVRRRRAVHARPRRVPGQLWGGDGVGSLFDQVRGTMLATVFVFLGVEGASVYSRYAQRREDVGRATVLGFLGVLASSPRSRSSPTAPARGRDHRPAPALDGGGAGGGGRGLGQSLR